MDSQEGRACAVCGRVLDYVQEYGWRHSRIDSPADHPAIPVERRQIAVRDRCDFCSADNPEWVVPARDFQMGLGQMSTGAWAACSECAKLIELNDWTGVVRRVKKSYYEKHHDVMDATLETVLRAMYRHLRKNITGPLTRLDDNG